MSRRLCETWASNWRLRLLAVPDIADKAVALTATGEKP